MAALFRCPLPVLRLVYSEDGETKFPIVQPCGARLWINHRQFEEVDDDGTPVNYLHPVWQVECEGEHVLFVPESENGDDDMGWLSFEPEHLATAMSMVHGDLTIRSEGHSMYRDGCHALGGFTDAPKFKNVDNHQVQKFDPTAAIAEALTEGAEAYRARLDDSDFCDAPKGFTESRPGRFLCNHCAAWMDEPLRPHRIGRM